MPQQAWGDDESDNIDYWRRIRAGETEDTPDEVKLDDSTGSPRRTVRLPSWPAKPSAAWPTASSLGTSTHDRRRSRPMTTAETVAVMDTRLLEQGKRIAQLEEWKANAGLTIWQLTEQVRILTGQIAELREAQKEIISDSFRRRQVL